MKTVLFFFMFSFIFYSNFAFVQSQKLDQNEVKILKELGQKLGLDGKKEWNFDMNPCIPEGNWRRGEYRKGFEVSVGCDCRNASTCYVSRIALKSQNISTTIPPEFSKLRYLKELDLSRNFLNGTVPPQWASLRLVDLSLMGNRLSGPFPRVLTRITTLVNLSMEGNRFSGSIPQEIGNMKSLQKLTLSSNAFTGQLPAALAKLTNLTDLRISDNNFTGKIPDFIGNWTQIGKLHIQGCNLEGPIPSSISVLTKLTDLRISDLKGSGSSFPPLHKIEALSKLILRDCMIHGTIPSYIGNMRTIKTLDLSFNNLTGEIPPSFSQLGKTDYIYLTQNNLSGPLPGWILSSSKTVDVSYNHFTWRPSGPRECPREGTINIVESYSSLSSNKQMDSCLKKGFPCSNSARQQAYSLYINCGGREVNVNTTTRYEADVEPKGASTYHMGPNWAFSSTGNFLDDDIDSDLYTLSNTSRLHNNMSTSETRLYTTARTAPISLTYYGLCLINGNYTVRLHFAEIIFSEDNSFNSLGKRVFDVYIQGELKLKDFDIVKEAGGTGRPVVKRFMVNVTSNTVKIQLFWAGKGTTGIPLRGSYGPIISAISVDPNFKPPDYDKKIEVGLIAGTVAGALSFVFLILLILWRKGYLMGKKDAADRELKGLDLQTGIFTLRQIKAATKNFDPSNKLGEGGFGAVYKGLLSDGSIIAVKQLSSKSKQGTREFVNEIGMISALQHPNLVKLYGCCVEGNQLSLIYEYMENNCLSRALFARDKVSKEKLTWPVRWKICLGIARGLVYLHEESQLKIVHRDIKTSNVLLDKDLNAKISDFGLAKLTDDGNTHISTRIAGTIGYMAPEYAMRGYLTPKADVYSFGIVVLETVSGKSNTNYRPKEDFVYLLDWAYVLQERGSLLELVDPDLGSEYSPEEAMTMMNVALLCTNASPTLRPTMSQAMNMLEGRTSVQDLLSDPGFSTINPKVKALRNHFWQQPSETLTMSEDPCTESLLSEP